LFTHLAFPQDAALAKFLSYLKSSISAQSTKLKISTESSAIIRNTLPDGTVLVGTFHLPVLIAAEASLSSLFLEIGVRSLTPGSAPSCCSGYLLGLPLSDHQEGLQ